MFSAHCSRIYEYKRRSTSGFFSISDLGNKTKKKEKRAFGALYIIKEVLIFSK